MTNERTASRRIPAIDLNSATVHELIERARLDHELARRIVEGRPYSLPEDLLRRDDLRRPSWAPSIVKLLLDGRTIGTDNPQPLSRAAVRRTHRTGIIAGF